MSRIEEARAEKVKEMNSSVDPLGLGISTSFENINNAFISYQEEMAEDEEVADRVKAVKGEVKAEVKAEVAAEVMQEFEKKIDKLKAELDEQKQIREDIRDNPEIDDGGVLQSVQDLETLEEDYDTQRIVKVVKEVLPTIPQPVQMPISSYQPEEKKKANLLIRFLLWLKIKIKNNVVFKLAVEIVISALVIFVFFEAIYLGVTYGNDKAHFDLIKAFLNSLNFLNDYIHAAIEQKFNK